MAKTRIGVIVCDHLPDDLQATSGGDLDLLYRNMLLAAEPELEVAVYPAVDGVLPGSADECEGWIITGSRHSAYCDEAWVVALREWLAEAAEVGARIAGVCFGHQLVAEALGGRVGRADRWKVGPQHATVESTDWFGGGEVHLNAMHQDVVIELPPDGRTIAEGTTSEIPAYLVGDNIVCVQDHPEFNAALTRALTDARLDRIDGETVESARQRLESVPTDGPIVAGWLVDFVLDRRRD